jgi:predicted NBD/HSP70 family sugar kinase
MQIGDPELMRAINRSHILDAIRRHEPISRIDLCRHTRLSRTTVSAIAADLIGQGLIHEERQDAAGTAVRGRPRLRLVMNPNVAFVVGVKLSVHQISVTVTNLKAEVLSYAAIPGPMSALGPAAVADLIATTAAAELARCRLSLDRTAGLGIGIPGFIDSAAGICQWSPIFGQGPIPFAAMVAARIDCPVIIENDANLVALAERWFGPGPETDNFVVVTVEHGVGMGLIIGGELYRGQHGFGGEFGHIRHDPQGGPSMGSPLCRCGRHGCLEAFVADYALLRDALALDGSPPPVDEADADRKLHDLIDRARNGDTARRALFDRAGTILGQAIATLATILDPGRIVLSSGDHMRAVDLLRPSLEAAFDACRLPRVGKPCPILFHDQGDDVWARGAASLVLQGLYRTGWVGGDAGRGALPLGIGP